VFAGEILTIHYLLTLVLRLGVKKPPAQFLKQ